jgi:hypothetical protein
MPVNPFILHNTMLCMRLISPDAAVHGHVLRSRARQCDLMPRTIISSASSDFQPGNPVRSAKKVSPHAHRKCKFPPCFSRGDRGVSSRPKSALPCGTTGPSHAASCVTTGSVFLISNFSFLVSRFPFLISSLIPQRHTAVCRYRSKIRHNSHDVKSVDATCIRRFVLPTAPYPDTVRAA